MKIRTLKWFGGKNPLGRVGPWVHGIVGDGGQTYIEPFCGMLGILIQRPPAKTEIVNDLNGRVVNFWRVVRDEPRRLTYLLRRTPQRARATFEWARTALDDPCLEPAMRAAALAIVCQMSVYASGHTFQSPRRAESGGLGYRPTPLDGRFVAALSRRLRRVVIENRDAVDLIRYHAHDPHALIYVDPPYAGRTNEYGVTVDYDALADEMLACRGRVVVSRADGEWDRLGWRRHEKPVRTGVAALTRDRSRRTEQVWESRPAE